MGVNETCHVSRKEATAAARIEKADATHSACLMLLANELQNALNAPDLKLAKVSTPAFGDERGGSLQMSVVDLFSDLFAGRGGDDILAGLLSLLAAACRGEQITHRAILLRGQILAMHAENHADELVRGAA